MSATEGRAGQADICNPCDGARGGETVFLLPGVGGEGVNISPALPRLREREGDVCEMCNEYGEEGNNADSKEPTLVFPYQVPQISIKISKLYYRYSIHKLE